MNDKRDEWMMSDWLGTHKEKEKWKWVPNYNDNGTEETAT